ncbi:DUF397 domain-containing protein [Streptomyces rubellomurinus]|uniref:DUF397 domain-containing protein n=1 Tax=Streptomyces rubellomurinus (strain ATCC 31215) TaxID=359131 RepID=UPI00099CC614|nr:DUF397 domain-containing protein [Streptomyces rubellomurinus]
MTDSAWQKSSYSSGSDDCVEVRTVHPHVELRESDARGAVVRATPTTLATFLLAAKAGEFDHHTP